jgi:hypothetical protein
MRARELVTLVRALVPTAARALEGVAVAAGYAAGVAAVVGAAIWKAMTKIIGDMGGTPVTLVQRSSPALRCARHHRCPLL